MPTIEYLAVESDLVVPGWNLRTPDALLFKAVESDVHVPGWFVTTGDPFDAPMEVILYTRTGYLTDEPLATLTQEEDRSWEWRDVLGDSGSCSITIPLDDELVDAFDTDDVLVAQFWIYGQLAFLGLLEGDEATDVSNDDEIGETITFNGRGAPAILEEGVVDPIGGPYTNPVQEDRHFGWPTDQFDHTGWVHPQVTGSGQDAINVGAALQAGLTDALEDWVEKLTEQVYRDVPTVNFPVLWPYPSDLVTAPVGEVFFYEDETMNPELNITEPGDYVIHFIADDEGEFYVNGQQVGQLSGFNWLGTVSVPVTLSAGECRIAARVRNLDWTAGTNTGKYSWVISKESPLTTALGSKEWAEVIATASANGVCLPYPENGTPGQAIIKTIHIALDECQFRGFLQDVSDGFSITTYSDGRPSPEIPDWSTKIGTTLLAFLNEMSAAGYIDWNLDPATLVLEVWEQGTQGLVTDATWDVAPDLGLATDATATTGNILSVRRTRERRRVRRLLLKWPSGWAKSEYLVGEGGEAPLELGQFDSLDEVQRVGANQLAVFNVARTQYDLTIRPERAEDAPYLGFRKGDYGTDRGESRRVQAIQVSTNPDDPDDPTIVVSCHDLVPTPEERMAADLRSLL